MKPLLARLMKLIPALGLAAPIALLALVACDDSKVKDRTGDEGGGTVDTDGGVIVGQDDEVDCEPCIAGAIECRDHLTQSICKPEGRCHVYATCPKGPDGKEQFCDADQKRCLPKVCDPGKFVSCSDGKTSTECNVSGTAEVDVGCDGCIDNPDDPDDEVAFPCLCKDPDEETGFDGGCAPLVCRPDSWACRGDEERFQCDETGTAWEFVEDCNIDAQGRPRSRICEVTNKTEDGRTLPERTARCISLCEEAKKLKSYIGCEYWAADLDNAFVRGNDPTGYYDAQGKQFAVAISNVNERGFEATVTVKLIDGQIWCKSWDDWGPPFVYQPNNLWCYKDKEKAIDGRRCDIIVNYDAEGRREPTEECLEPDEGGGVASEEIRIPAGEIRVLNLPRADLNGTMIGALGYQILADVPITAYQFNPLENEQVFSNDASLLLPISALGKDYVIMTREQTFEILRTYITVMAVRPGPTEIVVTTTAPTLPGNGIPAYQPGARVRFTLNQFDILNLESNCRSDARGFCKEVVDFTGSQVYGNKLLAVFGGSEASNAPNTNHCLEGACWDGSECEDNADCNRNITCCADHLEQQLFPVSTWGVRYVAAKTSRRGEPLGTGEEPDVWRILAGKDGTTVRTVPHQIAIPTLDRGEWVDFNSSEDFEIIADKAILVGQFLAAEHAPGPNVHGVPDPNDARTGDPAFIMGVPAEQFREDYVILAPDKYEHDFANIVAPIGAKVVFDEIPLQVDDFKPIADGEYAVLRLPIDDGAHRIRTVEEVNGACQRNADCGEFFPDTGGKCIKEELADEAGECHGPRPKVGVIVYGYDQFVSYGYPGGLNLKRINLCKDDGDCGEGRFCCLDEEAACGAESFGECVGLGE